MSNRDPFYDQRAAEVQFAIESGDIDQAADLIAQTAVDGGVEGLNRVTDAVKGD